MPRSEEDIEKDTKNLTEEEKKHREEVKVKRDTERHAKKEEEKKALDQRFAGLDELGKI